MSCTLVRNQIRNNPTPHFLPHKPAARGLASFGMHLGKAVFGLRSSAKNHAKPLQHPDTSCLFFLRCAGKLHRPAGLRFAPSLSWFLRSSVSPHGSSRYFLSPVSRTKPDTNPSCQEIKNPFSAFCLARLRTGHRPYRQPWIFNGFSTVCLSVLTAGRP